MTYRTNTKNLRLTLLYKIYYHQVAVDYAELDITHNPRPSRQHEHQIRQLPAWKNTFLFSFVTRTIPEWNSQPANNISADSATTFKESAARCHSVSSPSPFLCWPLVALGNYRTDPDTDPRWRISGRAPAFRAVTILRPPS